MRGLYLSVYLRDIIPGNFDEIAILQLTSPKAKLETQEGVSLLFCFNLTSNNWAILYMSSAVIAQIYKFILCKSKSIILAIL